MQEKDSEQRECTLHAIVHIRRTTGKRQVLSSATGRQAVYPLSADLGEGKEAGFSSGVDRHNSDFFSQS